MNSVRSRFRHSTGLTWMFLCVLGTGVSWADDAGPQIQMTLNAAETPISFEVTGLAAAQLEPLKSLQSFDPAFAELFAVYLVDPKQQQDVDQLPPLSGNYTVQESKLSFIPRHALQAGLTYRAVLRVGRSESQKIIQREVTAPAQAPKALVEAAVERIYPSANTLPENLLRFYIHFSQPMARGEAYHHLELLDAQGQPLEAAFLELGEELWDPSGQRFTLLLDPGRVKQGLKPREELGSVLQAGRKYELRVKPGWRDENGQRLKNEFRKSFTVSPVVNQPIQFQQWKYTPPPFAGTKGYLVVKFDRALDHALLGRMLWIEDDAGHRIEGTTFIEFDERIWTFRPSESWTSGKYHLVVDKALEDPAGNRIDRSFEVIRQNDEEVDDANKYERISFEVRQPNLPAE